MTSAGRVLVTGGTGALGVATTRWLTRAGHDVVVFARREPSTLPTGARFVRGDIRDPKSVRSAIDGCDTAVHLAWALSGSVTHAQAEPINIGGTRNVLHAMGESGCQRMVFASSVTGYGAHADHPQPWGEHERLDPAYRLVYEWHKARAEAMIIEAGVAAVRVRPTVIVGRDAHNAPANVYRQLAIPSLGGRAKIQMVHQDDAGRFFAHACDSTAIGPVNLAADDVLTWPEVARLARRRAAPTPPGLLIPAVRAVSRVAPIARSAPELLDLFLHWPLADTTRLKDDFGFRLGYSSAEAIADQGRHSTSYFVLGMKEIRRPTKLGRTHPRRPAQADAAGRYIDVLSSGACGEFDTPRADPNYPEWTCANLEEAFPGPMTPLSLELTRAALFGGADQVARILPVPQRVRDNIRRRQLGVFGHRLYQNVSVLREMAAAVPGYTPEDFDHQINGQPFPNDYVRPRLRLRDIVGYLKFVVTAGPRLAGLGNAVRDVERCANELNMASKAAAALSDEQLLARIEMLWGECIDGWNVALLCTFLVSAPTAVLQRRYGTAVVTHPHGTTANLASSRLLRGVKELSTLAQRRPEAKAILDSGIDDHSWIALQQADPEYARQVSALLDAAGHRGPGETELANSVYADVPGLLLRAVAGVSDVVPLHTGHGPARDLLGRLLTTTSWSIIAQRERCRDAVMRLTHQLRTALREFGSRRKAGGLLAHSDDVFYLTYHELFASSADLMATVARRRAERDRLAKVEPPLRFFQPMDLAKCSDVTQSDGTISGMPAVAGIAVGRVRLLRTPDDELEPGEVLVARVTDTGWTPFFATAAAVVTDIGGLMSHASIVAREFGIPAVVGTRNGSQLLTNGQLVEVNGATGLVTVVEEV